MSDIDLGSIKTEALNPHTSGTSPTLTPSYFLFQSNRAVIDNI